MSNLAHHAATAATFVLLTTPAWAAGVLELLDRAETPRDDILCASAQVPCAPPAAVGGPLLVSADPAAPLRATATASRQSVA